MLRLIIQDDDGNKTVVPFVSEEMTIGRQAGNTVQLKERNVSRRHARLSRKNGAVIIEDLGSYNGVRINGSRIRGRTQVANGDVIQIGDYDLALESEAADVSAPALEPSNPELQEGSPAIPAPLQTGDAQAETWKSETLHLDPSEAPHLVLLNTDQAGKDFECARSELIIGRDEDNDIAINHYSVAAAHAKLVRDDRGQWSLSTLDERYPFLLNGKSQTWAPLQSEDVVQLGSVQLRFVKGTGESTVDSRPPRSDRGVPLWAAGLVVSTLAFGIGAFVVWTFYRQSASLGSLVEPDLTPRSNPPAAPARQAETPPDAKQEARDRALAGAQMAYEEHDFIKAVETLRPVAGSAGTDEEVDELLAMARFEASAAMLLATAKRNLAEGNVEEARRILDRLNTNELAKERDEIRQQLKNTTAPRPMYKRPARSQLLSGSKVSTEEAQALYDEGKTLFLKRQYLEARTLFTKCLEVDPTYAYCHMMLGSTFAKLGEPEMGAQHYRQFVKLAPSDSQAPKVRTFLNQYEESKRINR